MKPIIFIDGAEGTTGLVIAKRLAERDDITVLPVDEARRKDPAWRKEQIAASDLTFLCLPDAAAIEAVELAEGTNAKIIDASTAHRTDPRFVYGFPELSAEQEEKIRNARLTANPGCHATGFISTVYPLIAGGLLKENAVPPCFSLTGYTGGGKKMIAAYESEGRPAGLSAPGIYGLTQSHKHLAEMKYVCGLPASPLFSPIVADFPQGMATTIQLTKEDLAEDIGPDDLLACYRKHYEGSSLISVKDDIGTTLYANEYAGLDSLKIAVAGNPERMTVTALFDNLGKGACGAAIENMNLMLGLPQYEGLIIGGNIG